MCLCILFIIAALNCTGPDNGKRKNPYLVVMIYLCYLYMLCAIV